MDKEETIMKKLIAIVLCIALALAFTGCGKKSETLKVGASVTPHAQILAIAKDILAAKDITLDVITVTDYVTPNEMVESGDVFANYFAHQPYQDDFNAQNGTHIVTIAGIHVEPMALYGGKQTDLAALGIAAE